MREETSYDILTEGGSMGGSINIAVGVTTKEGEYREHKHYNDVRLYYRKDEVENIKLYVGHQTHDIKLCEVFPGQ